MKTFVIGDIHGAHKALIQCIDRSGINKDTDRLIVLGDVVDGWNDVPECVDTLLEFRNLVIIRGNHDCYDIETEVFTSTGWKTYDTISETDQVLGLNKNGDAEWQPINSIIIKSSSELYEFNSSRISMCVTDRHRILHETKVGYTYSSVLDYDPNNSRFSIPLSSKSSIYNEYDIEDSTLKIIAWILTDGGIETTSKKLRIYQSKINSLNSIESLLKSNNISYKKYTRQRNTISIQGKALKSKPLVSHTLSLDLTYSKNLVTKYNLKKNTLPEWIFKLSKRQANVFINELINGDGTWYKNKNACILYGTYEFLSMVQGLCSMNGITANLTKDNRDTYRLNLNYNLNTKLRGKFNKLIGDFIVWDLTVPLSNMLVRRKNKAYYTGNSWFMDFCLTGQRDKAWVQQGGKATLLRYEWEKELRERHYKDFFEKSLIYYVDVDRNYAFMHGGYDWHKPLAENDYDEIMWDRHMIETAHMWNRYNITHNKNEHFKEFNKIFIGHTTTQHSFGRKHESSLEPSFVCNVVNMDTGAGWTGKLTILDVGTNEYWQSDLVKILYNEKSRW